MSERRNFVQLRLKRQEAVLGQSGRVKISVIMSELALLRRVVPDKTMRSQINELVSKLSGDLSWVDFRVTTLIDEPSAALGGPFYIIKFAERQDQDVVYLEGREEPDYLESDEDVSRYESFFAALEKASLSRADSLDRLMASVDTH